MRIRPWQTSDLRGLVRCWDIVPSRGSSASSATTARRIVSGLATLWGRGTRRSVLTGPDWNAVAQCGGSCVVVVGPTWTRCGGGLTCGRHIMTDRGDDAISEGIIAARGKVGPCRASDLRRCPGGGDIVSAVRKGAGRLARVGGEGSRSALDLASGAQRSIEARVRRQACRAAAEVLEPSGL